MPSPDQQAGEAPEEARRIRSLSRGLRWGSLLFSALFGLAGLGAALWFTSFIEEMLARIEAHGYDSTRLVRTAQPTD